MSDNEKDTRQFEAVVQVGCHAMSHHVTVYYHPLPMSIVNKGEIWLLSGSSSVSPTRFLNRPVFNENFVFSGQSSPFEFRMEFYLVSSDRL